MLVDELLGCHYPYLARLGFLVVFQGCFAQQNAFLNRGAVVRHGIECDWCRAVALGKIGKKSIAPILSPCGRSVQVPLYDARLEPAIAGALWTASQGFACIKEGLRDGESGG